MGIVFSIITTLATAAIAIFAYQSYKLSQEIKRDSDNQQKNINKFIMALIAASLFIAKYSHTSPLVAACLW